MKRTKIIPVKWIPDDHDSDWDGVPNYRDCQPFNPHKQGILHYGKLRCKNCYKWFPKDEMEYYNGWGPYCKNCIGGVKREKEDERKRVEESIQREMITKERCPHCGSRKFKLTRRDSYDKTGDALVCLKCRQGFLRYELKDWDMKKMGHKR